MTPTHRSLIHLLARIALLVAALAYLWFATSIWLSLHLHGRATREAGMTPDEADRLLDLAVRINPANGWAWYDLSSRGIARGDLDAARLASERALDTLPLYRARRRLMQVLYAQSLFDVLVRQHALEFSDDTLRIFPGDLLTINRAGWTAQWNHDFDRLRWYMDLADHTELRPNDPRYQNLQTLELMARMADHDGDYETARRLCEMGLIINPDSAPMVLLLAEILRRNPEMPDRFAVYDLMRQHYPQDLWDDYVLTLLEEAVLREDTAFLPEILDVAIRRLAAANEIHSRGGRAVESALLMLTERRTPAEERSYPMGIYRRMVSSIPGSLRGGAADRLLFDCTAIAMLERRDVLWPRATYAEFARALMDLDAELHGEGDDLSEFASNLLAHEIERSMGQGRIEVILALLSGAMESDSIARDRQSALEEVIDMTLNRACEFVLEQRDVAAMRQILIFLVGRAEGGLPVPPEISAAVAPVMAELTRSVLASGDALQILSYFNTLLMLRHDLPNDASIINPLIDEFVNPVPAAILDLHQSRILTSPLTHVWLETRGESSDFDRWIQGIVQQLGLQALVSGDDEFVQWVVEIYEQRFAGLLGTGSWLILFPDVERRRDYLAALIEIRSQFHEQRRILPVQLHDQIARAVAEELERMIEENTPEAVRPLVNHLYGSQAGNASPLISPSEFTDILFDAWIGDPVPIIRMIFEETWQVVETTEVARAADEEAGIITRMCDLLVALHGAIRSGIAPQLSEQDFIDLMIDSMGEDSAGVIWNLGEIWILLAGEGENLTCDPASLNALMLILANRAVENSDGELAEVLSEIFVREGAVRNEERHEEIIRALQDLSK